MKRTKRYIRMSLVAPILLIVWHGAAAQEPCDDSFRWDLEMIEEAPIWHHLLVNYGYADHKERWPERRRALEKIVREYPQSQWADDAALILACGKASFEDNPKGAIADLQKLVTTYPHGATIVAHWDPEDGCLLDDTWLSWQGGLVFLNADGSVRLARPFSRDGTTQREREALAYFRHLRRFPRATAVMTKLTLANVLLTQGQEDHAVSVLEDTVRTSRTYLAMVSRADRMAAARPDGGLIGLHPTRPEHRAHLALMRHYEKQGDMRKSFDVAQQLVELASKDGWLWQINEQVADLYRRNGQGDRARTQYQLALTGLQKHQSRAAKRSATVVGSELPQDFWSKNRDKIQRKIREAPR
ncbi:MAG: hypothetical protein JW741_29095 [Sedimentisphaerales bacterium]|nr:hypothetical protein [Sedimentisphaerales bacterium]